jgi:nucleoside-diphosphate-sugar epimerase
VASLNNLQWVSSTLTLLDAFTRAGGGRVVCAGTSAEYDWTGGRCVERVNPLRPATLYAACKASVCTILERLAERTGCDWAWGRIFFLYGPGEPGGRLLPSILEAELAGRPAELRHPGRLRDYMHVADVGGAFAALAASTVSGPVNIGSGEGVPLAELARLVRRALGLAPHSFPESMAEDPIPAVIADVSRLREEVGYRPQFSLEEGIGQTVNWWKSHRWKDEA